jgi:hypothetical protein
LIVRQQGGPSRSVHGVAMALSADVAAARRRAVEIYLEKETCQLMFAKILILVIQ